MGLQIYTPYVCDIVEIDSIGMMTTITFSIPHAFVPGNLVAFSIPPEYGMTQLNGRKAFVFDITDEAIVIVLDSSDFDPFVIPSVPSNIVLDPAQAIPAGDNNSGYSAPGGVLPSLTIPGTYQGIVI